MKATTIIFDVDGVLMDSVPLHFKAWKKLFDEEGIPFSYDDYLTRVNGLPRLTGVKNMAPNYNDDQLEQLAAKKQDYFLQGIEESALEPLDGVRKFLKELTENHFKLAAASSSKNARHILEKAKIDSYFQTIITGHDFKKSKPDPEIFLTAAERVQSYPQDSVVIEDATLGIQAAKNAGMIAIGLLSSNDMEIEKHADFIVPSIKDYKRIMEFLTSL